MFCKRLQATMTVNACQKRQKKSLTYLELEACRDCPQKGLVNAGLESDQDIFNMIQEIGLQCPLGLQQPSGIPALRPTDEVGHSMIPSAMEKSSQKGFFRRRMKTAMPMDHTI
jgi:hypothetical protein